jgi:hypothetical protein
MSAETAQLTTEEESRRVAEESRETEWAGRTFIRELFLGNFALPLVHPFPKREADTPEFAEFYQKLGDVLANDVDSILIDETGEYPEQTVDALREIGAFGIKIPKEYGGLGFSVSEYCKAMELVGSVDGNMVALLSAHQSIGVPQPLKLFGTEEQKQKYLTRCAKGAISRRRPFRRATASSSMERSSGVPMARWPSSSSSWRAIPRPIRSAPSSSIPAYPVSRSSTVVASWD